MDNFEHKTKIVRDNADSLSELKLSAVKIHDGWKYTQMAIRALLEMVWELRREMEKLKQKIETAEETDFEELKEFHSLAEFLDDSEVEETLARKNNQENEN